MSSAKIVKNVLGQLKQTGKIVGSYPAAIDGACGLKVDDKNYSRPSILELKSYNPTLSKADFLGLLPQTRFSSTAVKDSALSFEVVKMRDPRYFQFKDKYQLVFPDYKAMRAFSRYVEFSRLDGARPNFVVGKVQHPQVRYQKYFRNLEAAFHSSDSFFQLLKNKNEEGRVPDITLDSLRQAAKPIESKSLLVWNFPSDQLPYQIMDKFWFYDIKHCFKIYWDSDTGRTLTFMAFNSEEDCKKFNRNFHGVYFQENDDCKLLVEALT
ncbi:LANO_0F16116g1_1 [Lachancea nothofagi CBS 11611]|uniref:LANO_0F16116g1_1 n=1 Tax=Lachancea nothofagi CBS 11611 TaxID=1266666 RepID=A0A1G4KCW7_9SACH|nr:LANO_0F16116g1_1 [Lachancea nothofagi CBS 11611]